MVGTVALHWNHGETMLIRLSTRDLGTLSTASVRIDENGHHYVDHHGSWVHEFECALYGYLEGGVDHDTIDDDDGSPYIHWQIIGA